MKCSLFLLLLVSTLSAYTPIELGMHTCAVGIFTDVAPYEGGTVEVIVHEMPPIMPPIPPEDLFGVYYLSEIIATPNDGYVFPIG